MTYTDQLDIHNTQPKVYTFEPTKKVNVQFPPPPPVFDICLCGTGTAFGVHGHLLEF